MGIKKIYLLLILIFLFTACDSNSNTKEDANKKHINSDKVISFKVSIGASLVTNSNCKTCHRETQKVIGPSFADIAAKYPRNDANIDYIAHKIIKGGFGCLGRNSHDTTSRCKYSRCKRNGLLYFKFKEIEPNNMFVFSFLFEAPHLKYML
jgi:cytochrome c